MPALQKADASPELHRLQAHQVPAETQPRQPAGVEDALVGEVVNGEHGRDAPRRRTRPEHPGREHRQRGRSASRGRAARRSARRWSATQFEGRLRQKRESLGVVRDSRGRDAVQIVAIESSRDGRSARRGRRRLFVELQSGFRHQAAERDRKALDGRSPSACRGIAASRRRPDVRGGRSALEAAPTRRRPGPRSWRTAAPPTPPSGFHGRSRRVRPSPLSSQLMLREGLCHDRAVADREPPHRAPRAESRQTSELRALRAAPAGAGRRGRHAPRAARARASDPGTGVAAVARAQRQPSSPATRRRRATAASFEDIPLDLTDLRLMVRQTADVLRRFGALEADDHREVQALGRDMKLLTVVGSMVPQRLGTARRRRRASRRRRPPERSRQRAWWARCSRRRCGRFCHDAPRFCSSIRRWPLWTHSHCALVRRRAGLRRDHAGGRASSHLRPVHAALEVRAAHLPVLPEQRPHADHVVCDAGRAVPRLRVRRLSALSEGVRRPPRHAARSCRSSTASPRCRSTRPRFSAATTADAAAWSQPVAGRDARRRRGPVCTDF